MLKRQTRSLNRFKVLFAFLLLVVSIVSFFPKKSNAAHAVGLGIGQILLMGDFAKYFDNSLGYNILYNYDASNLFGLLAVINYNSHSNATGTNTLKIMGFSPNIKVSLVNFDQLLLFGYTGFGLMKVSQTVGTIPADVTTFGLNMGFGAELTLASHMRFGTGLSFHNIFGKTDSSTATANSTGTSIGGTYLALFLNIMYVF